MSCEFCWMPDRHEALLIYADGAIENITVPIDQGSCYSTDAEFSSLMGERVLVKPPVKFDKWLVPNLIEYKWVFVQEGVLEIEVEHALSRFGLATPWLK